MTAKDDERDSPGRRSGRGADSAREFITQDASSKALPASPPTQGVHRSLFTVLVVDDNAGMRYAVGRAMRREGYQTIEVGTGAECLVLAAGVAAVLLDVHLPDIDGIEVCRLLRADPSLAGLPIVHLSAVEEDHQAPVASAAVGANAYVVAPADLGELAELVDRLLVQGRPGDASRQPTQG
jgi:CheY-like chemotaxis protein